MAYQPVALDELRSIAELESHREDVVNEIEAYETEYAGLPYPDDVKEPYARLRETNDEIKKRVAELRAREEYMRTQAGNERSVESTNDPFRYERDLRGTSKERDIYDMRSMPNPFAEPEKARSEFRDRALRAIELANVPGLNNPRVRGKVTTEDIQTHLEYLIENTQETYPGEMARHLLVTGSPAYKRAFGKALAQRPLNSEEQRALGLGATVGGQAVPFTLDPTVIPTSNSVVNPTRALARIETITGSNTWNGISSGAITASRVAEATVATDNSPTMAAPTLTVTKAHAFVPFSIEIEEDWGSIGAELAKLFQDAKDDEEGAAFVTGVGTTVNPQGFVTGTTNTSAATTGLTVTAADVYALEAALPPRFRPNESFVANRAIYNRVRGIDTAGGAALWLYISQGLVTQSPTPGNTGATLLGRGAWEASAMQATVVNATKIMVVGDFNYFLILDRIGLHIELIPTLFGASQGNIPVGQRAYYCWWRNSSKVLSASAFVAMTGTT
jgi:HK97 family phage major capsid protein